ncbi:MAG: orotate phosphoribosyltransferase [Gammaproteobacteria bacterium]|nr:orotate phosphoribosyltransferase [Gammaproteobacteria bacterium]
MIAEDVLQFGDFELKSGRRSPYFFNLGAIDNGAAFDRLGAAYAALAMTFPEAPQVLFGPAYKGIPIAVAASVALAREHGVNVGVAFNRKEAKAHGEGGRLVGSGMDGRRVVVVDDTITDGAAKIEACELIAEAGGRVTGVLIAMDRRERVAGGNTAVGHLEGRLGVPVRSVARLEDVVGVLAADPAGIQRLETVSAYRDRYCAVD